MQFFAHTLSENTITLDVNDSTHERFKPGQVHLSKVDVCVCEGVFVDGAMILVSGSSGFRSRRTMRNQQPVRD